jgi:uncharacterized protein YqeY
MDMVLRLQADMKAAMKAGDKQRLSVIRMILSDAQTADLRKTTPEEAIASYAKKLAKSAEEYQKYGKAAEVEQLKAELVIVQEYLPKKASTEDTRKLVEEFLAKNNFTEKQIGQAMGQFMKAHGQQVDAAIANQLIKQKLGGK